MRTRELTTALAFAKQEVGNVMRAAERIQELITLLKVCFHYHWRCGAGSGGVDSGMYDGSGVCIANSGSCDAGSGANTGTYNGVGICLINTGACNAGGGTGSGMYDGSGICIANSGSCNAGGGANRNL
ncbi:MAG: hypothetical protein ACNYPH_04700 [Gammaproteobacteria bacterium WSBS_2016_MAG_OTU1]